MKALKFDPKVRISPIKIIICVAIASVVMNGIFQGIHHFQIQSKTHSEAPEIDPNSPQALVRKAYDDFLVSSNATHQELVKARTLTILEAANKQDQPIIWLREHAIATEQQLKDQVNANLLWSAESIHRVAQLQLDMEAYGLLLKSLTDGSQSSINASPDILNLSKRVEALRGTWDVQYVERRFPNE